MTTLQKTKESIGYINIIKMLDELFNGSYVVRSILLNDDLNSSDFRMIVDFSNLKGTDISVANSGKGMYRIGDGVAGISVPDKIGLASLPSGLRGSNLSDILQDDEITWGASANDFEDVLSYFEKFKKYYEENYC